jgi:hypothetical protein
LVERRNTQIHPPTHSLGGEEEHPALCVLRRVEMINEAVSLHAGSAAIQTWKQKISSFFTLT